MNQGVKPWPRAYKAFLFCICSLLAGIVIIGLTVDSSEPGGISGEESPSGSSSAHQPRDVDGAISMAQFSPTPSNSAPFLTIKGKAAAGSLSAGIQAQDLAFVIYSCGRTKSVLNADPRQPEATDWLRLLPICDEATAGRWETASFALEKLTRP